MSDRNGFHPLHSSYFPLIFYDTEGFQQSRYCNESFPMAPNISATASPCDGPYPPSRINATGPPEHSHTQPGHLTNIFGTEVHIPKRVIKKAVLSSRNNNDIGLVLLQSRDNYVLKCSPVFSGR